MAFITGMQRNRYYRYCSSANSVISKAKPAWIDVTKDNEFALHECNSLLSVYFFLNIAALRELFNYCTHAKCPFDGMYLV